MVIAATLCGVAASDPLAVVSFAVSVAKNCSSSKSVRGKLPPSPRCSIESTSVLARETVPVREIREILKVALSAGSSKQGYVHRSRQPSSQIHLSFSSGERLTNECLAGITLREEGRVSSKHRPSLGTGSSVAHKV